MNATLPRFEVVLWGVGHTHAHVVRMWRMRPTPGARLTCVRRTGRSPRTRGCSSASWPGCIRKERMEIDLCPAPAAAGAR